MLQPDLLFSYGLSSGLAIAAGKKLKSEGCPWVNKYFITTVLWLSVCFVPQVLYLLWRFPAWESMFVAKDYSDIPAWLVAVYPIAILVLGALGFYVTYFFLVRDKPFAAVAQVIWSFGAAVFLVTIGWDGTGYKRLLYVGTGADWINGVTYPFTDFFASPVFFTLLWLQSLALIPYGFIFVKWVRENKSA
ncbi:MAG: hypothetical protein JSU92_00285 [Deltaproteobacteria bacterium]|nr:MAG: hypothetical protein JSU92_00285 [Deltaproteobacteria bacterium]